MNDAAAISTRDLTKRYGGARGRLALEGLDLTVRPGEVYGLIGPNGAGKTTFLRLLLGLIRPTSGEAILLGEPAGSPTSLRRIGAVVEQPAFYPFLSGRDNLRVVVRYAGSDEERIGPALERVGLSDRARDRVGGYSLGMRQRLGLAAAYVKDPELYLLDEPTNGLDPYGIAAMRGVIRGLADEGKTVLLSSHLLSEVEQVCDRIGIIHLGHLLREERTADLQGTGRIRIVATPVELAQSVLAGQPGIEEVELLNGAFLVTTAPDNAAALNRALVTAGVEVAEIRTASRTLEEAFMALTGEAGAVTTGLGS